MKGLVFLLCSVIALTAIAVPCYAVSAEERVVDLPQDQDAWYVSIVGSSRSPSYHRIVGWFSTHDGLKDLRSQVHYHQVTSNTATYRERYAPNVKALPTVRVQDGDGAVIYEAAGNELPATAEALYADIADQVCLARGCTILPWRKEIEKRLTPAEPESNETQPAVPFTPPVAGPPVIASPRAGLPVGAGVGLAILASVIGGVGGLAVQWRKTYKEG